LLSKFRFISVYYGSLLEPFLSSGGEAIETKSSLKTDYIIRNERNTRRKISLYKMPVTATDTFHYKTFLYFISFILGLVEKLLIKIF